MLVRTAGACCRVRVRADAPICDHDCASRSMDGVVATSGIGAHKTGTEREAFNRLSSGTRRSSIYGMRTSLRRVTR